MNVIKPTEKIFMDLLGSSINNSEYNINKLKILAVSDWQALLFMSNRHKVTPTLFDPLIEKFPNLIPKEILKQIQDISMLQTIEYYKRYELTGYLLTLMEEHKIKGIVLKGIGLSALYPKEELRKTNDVDIYIWDEIHREHFCTLLLQKGFVLQHCEALHHQHFIAPANPYSSLVVEVHSHIVSSFHNPLLDSKIESIYGNLDKLYKTQCLNDLKIPILPDTLNALYLILHMLHHFIYRGFGVRLLCDFMIFLSQKKDEINFIHLQMMLEKLQLKEFTVLITQICYAYFSFPKVQQFFPQEPHVSPLIEDLLVDILHGGDLGKYDKYRIRCMTHVGDKKDFKSHLSTLHLYMEKRYPKLSTYKICWPILWVFIATVFLYENTIVKRSSLKKVLSSYRTRSQLCQNMQIGMEKNDNENKEN